MNIFVFVMKAVRWDPKISSALNYSRCHIDYVRDDRDGDDQVGDDGEDDGTRVMC